MYINLLLGLVALVVLWVFARRIFSGEESPTEKPAVLLKKEAARKRAREKETAAACERLRETAEERLRPVLSALHEMREALPELMAQKEGNTSAFAPNALLEWENEGERLVIRIRENEDRAERAQLVVTWRAPTLDLQKAAQEDAVLPGRYFLLRSDQGTEEAVMGLDACLRGISAFIVDFMV